jgi:hypothetical protein
VRHCRRRTNAWFFLVLFGAAAVVSSAASNVHIVMPTVWVQLLIGVGVVAVLAGVGYLLVWKG